MPIADLFGHRPAAMGRMLKPFTGKMVPCQPHATIRGNRKIIGAHGRGTPPDSDYRNWRFKTLISQFECQYFECWILNDAQIAHLDRAYLHLFEIDRVRRQSRQVLSVHAQPTLVVSRDCPVYRRTVHLHVDFADHVLKKCHFPLVASHLPNHMSEVLQSLDNLTSVFKQIAEALADELRLACA